ncbi:MAG: 1-(5-phosphoribosyl)-5-[(5-phosphoribosylamino)methylideneamino]imidazole-4-carboxamide isomerase [Roseiflexaceae bacterium]
MTEFIVYPAIDLRGGKVVRLAQGDLARQTVYSDDPAATAQRWLDAGATWLHVVNLDGSFGEAGVANAHALEQIVATGAQVQLGGGMRSLTDIERVIALGVARAIIGTAAVENPELVPTAITRFGAQRIGAGIDARDGRVRVRGWLADTGIDTITLGAQMRAAGVELAVFTDVGRDGIGTGVNVEATIALAQATGLRVIASGGVATAADVWRVRDVGLAGVIIGRALYEGQIDLREVLDKM